MPSTSHEKTNTSINRQKKVEALQEFYETFSKWITGLKKQGLFKGYKSALTTIFLESNPTNIQNIFLLIQKEILPGGKFIGTIVQEINKGLELHFFNKKKKSEKMMIIFAKGALFSYEVWVFNKILPEVDLPFPIKAMKRTLNEIKHIFFLKVYYRQSTIGFENIVCIRGNQLVSNTQEHAVLAILENKGQSDEVHKIIQQIHRRFLSGVNSVKTIHASKEILIKKINHQCKIIQEQNLTITNIRTCLQKKIEEEGGEISDEMEKIAYTATENVTSKNIDISNFHPIFQELICIQSEKPNGVRYHPMFLRWAISVYSRSGNAAYNAMKTIMRLPSISTLKSYINESEQHSGWQDKIASQMLESLTTNKIWGYGRVGFFSHDSFKIQKGLLWSQRENCYVGYLDFENEMQDYQSFALQCQCEISGENNSLSNTISEKQKQKNELATQVHQIVWHSTTHNFAFPIAYYGINILTAHNLNTLIFNLAAKLECIGIHTYGSICDGAGENRTHIKSFDWYASTWSSGDLVEINFDKTKKSFYAAEIIGSNSERSKFIVRQLNHNNSEIITIDRAYIHPPMPLKLEWNVNKLCEFKNPDDNQWYLGKIIEF
ncbi:4-coumarate--CoA ligase 1-like [Rhizophagus irregularis DAOM 181602=DAOM 197198]|nr:4-coumarate--CoA ligase 1-like [Rhizophagus irregularis DAOM 181602=DAOM 197198]